jgi:hypothetical protein
MKWFGFINSPTLYLLMLDLLGLFRIGLLALMIFEAQVHLLLDA